MTFSLGLAKFVLIPATVTLELPGLIDCQPLTEASCLELKNPPKKHAFAHLLLRI